MEDIKAGTEVLIKRARQGRYRFYGWEYTKAVVSRTTKARIFVKYAHQKEEDATEREFNRSDLAERGPGVGYSRAELLIDSDKIHAAELEQAAEKARRALEQAGRDAMAELILRFGADSISNRKDGEIHAFIAAVSAFKEAK
jgi:hypothetical protein